MIETVLVALENSLNLVGVLGHYKSFVRAVSRTGAETGRPTGGSNQCFRLLSFQVSLMWINISRSCVGTASFHILMALI